jgi:DNA topoisomerase-1
LNDSFKYVWLAASSRVKGESNLKKFETARKLKNEIEKIRNKYTKDLKSKDLLTRQRATAIYIIDHLALRVGNEKDEEEADTVGCCSLRVEHVTLIEPDTIKFDFLGKDSMRYQNTVKVTELILKNMKKFCKGKKKDAEIFDKLTVFC